MDRDFRLGGVRSISGWYDLEGFLASAVAAVLVIRAVLSLTGFPRIGGHGLHIAHMLWGGAFMLAALVLLLTLLGPRVKHAAAILGGVGFGTFIDELGKFITSDNNYFFRPTISLIYLIFVLLFLLFRQIESQGESSPEALLANAAEVLLGSLSGGATTSEIRRGLARLDRCAIKGPVADGIRQALLGLPNEAESPSMITRIDVAIRRRFDLLTSQPGFPGAILVLFLAHATVFAAVAFALSFQIGLLALARDADLSVSATGALISSLFSSSCMILGVARWRWSRPSAYLWFKRGVLTSILLVQVFIFYASQVVALAGLALDLVLLLALNRVIREAGTSRSAPDPAEWLVPRAGGHGQSTHP